MLRLTLYGRFALVDANGAEIALASRKARGLLAYLALSPGMSRSREQIMALLWSDRAETQARGSLRQVLTGLRKDLGDVLASDNERVTLDAAQISIAAPDGQELLAGFHLNDEAFEEWLRDERLRPEQTRPVEVRSTEKPDIAVLPFENMSALPEQETFSDGITEDIITELTRFSAFTVYSPWSSFHYDADKTTEQIARDLEIDYVLEGSVRREGDRVRITAMLFDVETCNHVWIQRYDRELGDVFAVQEEVARDITVDVSSRIEADACDDAWERPEAARSAYDHVLLGEWAQHEDWGSADAAGLYEKAILADPDCARAHANLANWHASSIVTRFVPMAEARDRVRRSGETALTLAPGDAIVLATLADAYMQVGDLTLARQCIEKALRANPNHHAVMLFAASTFAWLGDMDKAQDWLARYLRHDPMWTAEAMQVCLEVHYMAGRFEEAVASVVRWSDVSADLAALSAAAHAQSGRLTEAAELRARYEAGLPEGARFEAHMLARVRLCPDATLVARWEDGFCKAGFAV